MYEKVPTSLNFAERERNVLNFWRENEIFKKSIELREDAPIYTFFEGPPTANGQPHIGHVITRAVKDLIPRYKTMKGYRVLRKAGWDTHGLPVELEVEKKLGISGKPEIETFGVEPFINECKQSVWKYETLWREMSERVGYWLDMDAPYVTYHNDYIESVWWALSEIWKQGLIYKSYRVVPYCPRCGTPLSSHEVAQGYKEVKEDSAYVCFRVAGKENEFFLAWTTTPWTLPSNVGLCVNPKEEYAKVSKDGRVYILAKALAEAVLESGRDAKDDSDENAKPYTILETLTGEELEGLKYEPLFDFASPDLVGGNPNYCTVVCDGYVTLTDGTGIVHIAPAYGEDDARISKAYDLPLLQMVDAQGKFISDAHLWEGKFVKDSDPLIIKELAARGLLFKKSAYTHSYPFCWRCDTHLLYYARDAWFIRMSSLRDKLMASNSTVNWLPEHMKDGRFGNFLENVIDWSISRERYWGTPLPIWLCESESCDYRHCVGSIKELRNLAPDTPADIELHKPYIDAVKFPCPKCGSTMSRTPEVIDCWFDSGAMPFAQWHYPFENAELFKQQFPADFISEAVDQTRGWFYSLLAISTMLFEKSPYKNVIVLGHGLDENGQKMSKSKGNAVSPMDALLKHGADAVRWFLFSNSAPWLNFRYSDDTVTEGARRFMGTLWNTYAFYVLYAEIDGFNPFKHETAKPSVMDKWLLSRLNTLVKQMDESLENLEITEPARALDQFVDELSNWYLRRSRERYWAPGMEADKISAYQTLHHALVTVAKLAAPFVPFITEQIYQNLVCRLSEDTPESVHLCEYPPCYESKIDTELEAQMAVVMEIVVLGRSARNASNIKNRQPLAEMLVALPSTARDKCENLRSKFLHQPISAAAVRRNGLKNAPDDSLLEVVRDELNVKAIRFIDEGDAGGYVSYKFKPQLRTLGPRYGKLVPKITEALNAAPSEVMAALKSGQASMPGQMSKAGTWAADIGGTIVELTMDDVLVETMQKEGFSAMSDRGITVVLDTALTPELIEEGNVSELISKWQNMRREADFNVTDRIKAGFDKASENAVLPGVIQRNCGEISRVILADSLEQSTPPAGAFIKEWNVNGEKIELWVIR
ncbi:MAG: isoleucine--tRNA ligase [Defluviitaleaceae bacterium]|nr:isoleucine--tRNA ligase [Defluviitaleaceae bacterium]